MIQKRCIMCNTVVNLSKFMSTVAIKKLENKVEPGLYHPWIIHTFCLIHTIVSQTIVCFPNDSIDLWIILTFCVIRTIFSRIFCANYPGSTVRFSMYVPKFAYILSVLFAAVTPSSASESSSGSSDSSSDSSDSESEEKPKTKQGNCRNLFFRLIHTQRLRLQKRHR